jgi:hypothetical protein
MEINNNSTAKEFWLQIDKRKNGMSVSGNMSANYQVIFEHDPLVHSQKKGTHYPTLPCRMASTASLIDEKPAEGEFALQ